MVLLFYVWLVYRLLPKLFVFFLVIMIGTGPTTIMISILHAVAIFEDSARKLNQEVTDTGSTINFLVQLFRVLSLLCLVKKNRKLSGVCALCCEFESFLSFSSTPNA